MYDMDRIVELAQEAMDGIPVGVGFQMLEQDRESWAHYLRFLYAVVKEYKPAVVLELGVYRGIATAHMALANSDTLVIGVDRHFQDGAWGVGNMFDNIRLVNGTTTDLATYYDVCDVIGDEPVIGLVFLDSTHDGETPWQEFKLYSPLFADEVLVVCDDLLGPKHLKDKMQEFWAKLPGEKAELHFLHPARGANPDTPGFGVSIIKFEDEII